MVGKSRRSRAVIAFVVTTTVLLASACTTSGSGSHASSSGIHDATFAEPVTLASKNGVLEVNLTAHQGTAALNTVAVPVENFLVFSYEVIKGTSSDGKKKGDNTYPSPTLRVDPGETLIVHMANELDGLTIEDYYDPAFTPAGQTPPLYPQQLTSSPFNLHTHGLHVSPGGNSDNVLLDIPAGMGNTYTYDIPSDMPNGMYWYHSHRHTLTAEQTYQGLAGLLEIGRSDGNIPVVTDNKIPIRNMAIQYNYVFDRKGSGQQINNVNWPQYVSTLQPPTGSQLADGTYVPTLAPVDFTKSATGTQFFTNWYSGPLSISNNRGQYQFLPSNLQSFAPTSASSAAIPANPSLPDAQRDVQFTVNGQFQPTATSKPGQTEIWVLANISDFAYLNLTLTETATGHHPKFAVIGQDGNPYPEVHNPTTDDGTTLLIPPASRYVIAVTMPQEGDLVLEMPPQAGTQPMSSPGILYTNNGTANPPATLGTVNVDPSAVSYMDGFFVFPTQVLARVQPGSGQGRTTDFSEGQALNAYTSFFDASAVTPDVKRTLTISGGFGNTLASDNDPKAFVYEFDDNAFPYVPLIQPRLGSVEEWNIVNLNNDQHPMHIHVNDFQVEQVIDPTDGTTTGVQMWGQDNANVPYPTMDSSGNVVTPGSLTLRTKFTQFTGTYVIHCHRLNHEDNGLMAIINVIPAVSTYAVAVPGAPGVSASVNVYDGNGDRLVRTVTPFPGFEGTPTVTMGDVDGDQVLDLVVGAGAGAAPEVVAYSGAATGGTAEFGTELTRFTAFDSGFRGGVDVATANIEAKGLADNIIVSSGPGIGAQVNVYSSALSTDTDTPPDLFSTFVPYADSKTGVSVAAGMVDAMSGRSSIVTAPGPGSPADVKTFRYDLYTVNDPSASTNTSGDHAGHDSTAPVMTSEFLAFDPTHLGGVSLTTGWVAGAEGGAQSIIVGMLDAPGTVRTFSAGSALDAGPALYLQSPSDHSQHVTFAQTSEFTPFDGSAAGGVRVATSTVTGADVLVSGLSADGSSSEVRRYALSRAKSTATTLTPTLLGRVVSMPGSRVVSLGGD
jgi:FtsP/CotA-like multicopper oxidase with cupredoxin domain